MISMGAWGHPRVASAVDRAANIINTFLKSGTYAGHEQMAREVLSGWAYASLLDAIALELLNAEGFDIDGLVEFVEDIDWINKGQLADAYAEFDRGARVEPAQ